MTAAWCCRVLDQAIENHGQPEIVNTDQGSQFTSEVFSDYVVKDRKARLSMDGKGRVIDNIFIERLWRSVKYEHVYLFPASDGLACYKGLEDYFDYYNDERRHQSLDNETPLRIYQQNQSSMSGQKGNMDFQQKKGVTSLPQTPSLMITLNLNFDEFLS